MQQEKLKCKQVAQKVQSTQKELKRNNHKVANGLNKDFTEIVLTQEKWLPL